MLGQPISVETMASGRLFSRRAFLGGGLGLIATASLVPGFLSRTAMAQDLAIGRAARGEAALPADRILVVIELTGGNDGLNSLVPFGSDAYYKARPTLAIPPHEVRRLKPDTGVGLHPQLWPLLEMMAQGQAAIVQGVGYPNPTRSHFAAMDVWQAGSPDPGKGGGWLGRALDHLPAHLLPRQGPDDSRRQLAGLCVSIGEGVPLAVQGRYGQPCALRDLMGFAWEGEAVGPELKEQYAALGGPGGAAGISGASGSPDSAADFVRRAALDARLASDRIRAAALAEPATAFARGPLADQLRVVAGLIRGGLEARIYYARLDGFDTHADQGPRHAWCLNHFAAAVSAFYAELAALGQAHRVLTLAYSEFGRRVAQNGSQGTDHGAAAPVFLLGPSVQPGLHGEHPSLTQLDDGDLMHSVDFRCVYAAVLEQWLGVDSTVVLGRGFAPLPVLSTPS